MRTYLFIEIRKNGTYIQCIDQMHFSKRSFEIVLRSTVGMCFTSHLSSLIFGENIFVNAFYVVIVPKNRY